MRKKNEKRVASRYYLFKILVLYKLLVFNKKEFDDKKENHQNGGFPKIKLV